MMIKTQATCDDYILEGHTLGRIFTLSRGLLLADVLHSMISVKMYAVNLWRYKFLAASSLDNCACVIQSMLHANEQRMKFKKYMLR